MRYIFFFILVITLLTREFFYLNERHIYHDNEQFQMTYSIMHEPKKNSISQYFFADGVMVTTALYPTYHYGDTIKIEGIVSKKQSNQGTLLIVENPKITLVPRADIFLSLSKYIRGKVEDSIIGVLPEREAGLLLGIILGVRDKIDSSYYVLLKNAGVLHVIAASGQNVSIAAALLLAVFQRVVKRKVALVFTGFGVLLYATLTGFDPPIVRASVMAILAFAALFTGRQIESTYVLFLTGWGMLFYQPQELIDVSFQLSFLATFGILILKPILDRVVTFRLISFLKDDITTTLSAQIATFPVMIAAFGAYSLLSFPINILLLWTIPIIMILGGVGGLLALFSPLLAAPFILLCFPFLTYFTGIVVYFSRFNFQLTLQETPITLVVGYYLILLGIVIKARNIKTQKK